MNVFRAINGYSSKLVPARVSEDVATKKSDMTNALAVEFAQAADLQAQVLALVADPVSGDPYTGNYPMYYSFARQCRMLQKAFGGGFGLSKAVYERYMDWLHRGALTTWLATIMTSLFGVQPEAQPASLGTITPANHAIGVARSGTISFTGGSGYRTARFKLVKHSDLSVVFDRWTYAKSIDYGGLEALTLYDLTIDAYSAGAVRESLIDFTTAA